VIGNLLSNAIKFTHSGGQVTVAAGPEAGGRRVSVADIGRGIAPEDLPYLFEKFRSVQSCGTANEPGSCLGLAIVRALVELHGGLIEVASDLSGGSTFTIHLPEYYTPSG